MARFNPKFRQDLRKLERLVGRGQATALRRKVEARAQQAARRATRGTGSQQAAASHEPQVFDRLVRRGTAGWVNVPGKPVAVLVEKGTGWVGIGTLLPDAAKAETLPFVRRGSNVAATSQEIKRDFNSVKNSGLTNTRAPGFRHLTNIDLSEAEAELKALADMKDFIRIIRSSDNFPEFDTYPVTAKMGLLDMVYTLGAKGTREEYPVFTSAVRRRNFKLAARESYRPTLSAKRNGIVRAWLDDAARKEHFFIHPTCKKQLKVLVT
jgi:hypothetical protein